MHQNFFLYVQLKMMYIEYFLAQSEWKKNHLHGEKRETSISKASDARGFETFENASKNKIESKHSVN